MEQLDQLAISHSGTMRFWGEWFGRPMDNYHTVVHVHFDKVAEILTLTFDNDETCIIYHPKGVVSTPHEFYVEDASRVVWKHYYYGREHTVNNLRSIEYEKTDAKSVLVKAKYSQKRINPTGFNAVDIC